MRKNYREIFIFLRERKGFSASAVAKVLGMNLIAYTNFEMGSKELSIEDFARLCTLYNISADDVLGIINTSKVRSVKSYYDEARNISKEGTKGSKNAKRKGILAEFFSAFNEGKQSSLKADILRKEKLERELGEAKKRAEDTEY